MRKRSICAIGSAYVPSESSGFIVAITTNGSGSGVRLRADRHLTLLHRFEQRRLHFRGRAIDFVGEHDVGEDRAEHGRERALALVEDPRADDVARQQVGRELDAFELAVQRGRQRAAGERLGNPGGPSSSTCPFDSSASSRRFDDVALADDRALRGRRTRSFGVAFMRVYRSSACARGVDARRRDRRRR